MSELEPIGISPQQAWKMMQDDPTTHLVDVRSSMEFLFVGHPTGAVHIPWMNDPDWDINPHFVTDIRKLLAGQILCATDNECAAVILICRSGNRTLAAGKLLVEAGLKRVFHVEDGFEGELDDNHHRSAIDGWRHAGLPWEQC